MRFWFCLFSFFFCALPIRAFDLASRVQEITLANGMKWIVVRRPGVPVFSGKIVVRAGGLNETPGKTGLAHMFEHMAFKGSPDITKDEIWSSLVRNGAKEDDLNAYTSKDITVYQASLPAVKFELWAYITSEMIFRPIFFEFYKERDVVMEERRMRVDNSPEGFTLEKMIGLAFPSGPYSWSVIGKPEEVQSLEVDDARKFHRDYYHPNNMVGVLVGDLDLTALRPTLERYFGRFPRAVVKPDPKTVAIPPGEKRETIYFNAKPFLLMAFHKPNVPHSDDYVFDMINGLLCQGRTSRLEEELVRRQQLLASVWCTGNWPGGRLPNLFLIAATPMAGRSLSEVEEAITQELEKLKTAVEGKHLDRVRKNIRSDLLWSLTDNMGLAGQLGENEVVAGSWRYVTEYDAKVAGITPKQVEKVAQKYFVPANRVVLGREKK